MARTLVIDLDRCSGCDSCIVACKFENAGTLGSYRSRTLAIGPYGEYPDIDMYWMPLQCQQCENAACIEVCPTGASHRADNGVVIVDDDVCIGCQLCMGACPYGARSFNAQKNIVEKCTLCNHYTSQSDGRENPDDSFDPAHAVPPCVHNCPAGARFFGDIDDPDSMASRAIERAGGMDSEKIHRVQNVSGANPTAVYILSPEIAEWRGIPEEATGGLNTIEA